MGPPLTASAARIQEHDWASAVQYYEKAVASPTTTEAARWDFLWQCNLG